MFTVTVPCNWLENLFLRDLAQHGRRYLHRAVRCKFVQHINHKAAEVRILHLDYAAESPSDVHQPSAFCENNKGRASKR